MKRQQIDTKFIREALAQYSAELTDDGTIKSSKGLTSVRIKAKGNRLRMESTTDDRLIFSGGMTTEAGEHFGEKYWLWEKMQNA